MSPCLVFGRNCPFWQRRRGKSGCAEKLRGRVVILAQRARAVGAPRLGQLILLVDLVALEFSPTGPSLEEGRRVVDCDAPTRVLR